MSDAPYQLFDVLSEGDYAALKEDIRQRGILVPVEYDDQGHILDGHHRVKAWDELIAEGVPLDNYQRVTRPGMTEEQKRNHVRALNLLRRHMSKDQRAATMTAMRVDGMTLQEIADATGVSYGTVHGNLSELISSEVPATTVGKDGKARPTTYAPRKVGTAGVVTHGETATEKARTTLATVRPEVTETARYYGLTDHQLIQLLHDKWTTETVQEVVASGRIQYEGGDDPRDKDLNAETTAWDLQGLLRFKEQEYRRRANDERLQGKFSAVQTLPQTTYSVVYADPPWHYDNSGLYGSAEHHYPTISTDALCDFLESISLQVTNDAVIFMWATNPLLLDAQRVMAAWDFNYKTNFVWVKDRPTTGLGVYARGQHELLLLGTRGSFQPNFRYTTLITGVKEQHSAKPESLYGMIETMYPDQHYVELFARDHAARDGWFFYGNQAVEHAASK